MYELMIFLMGFAFCSAVLPLVDVALQMIGSKAGIVITRDSVKTMELAGTDKQDDDYRIGFMVDNYKDDYYEDDDDFENRKRKRK